MEFIIPSKTFLLGEYLALHQGPALLAATSPSFKLSCFDNASIDVQSNQLYTHDIHPQSPAGRLLADHRHLFKDMTLSFYDPHNGLGGFGASGAQFLGVYQAIQTLNNEPFNQDHLAMIYRRYHDSGSGADIITQLYGQITLFKGIDNLPETIDWPFTNLGFMLVRTGFKLHTHDHLKALSYDLPFASMSDLVVQAVCALHQNNELSFIQAIHDYGELLQKHDLLYEPVKPLIQSWQQRDGVVAVKGCGAMGADVLLVLYKKNVLKDHDYDYVACDTNLTRGLYDL